MATHYFASHKGGIEIVAEQLYRGLAAKRHEVVWAAGNSTPPPDPIGTARSVSLLIFNFVERKTGLPFPVPTLGAIKQIRAEVNHSDVVVLHDCLYLSNIATFLLAKWRGMPTVIIQHIGFVPYENPALRLLMRIANSIVTRPMLLRAEQVIFISGTTKTYFRSLRFQRAPELIFNGVDAHMYYSSENQEAKQTLRCKYGLPQDRPVVLFVGRFVEKKGLRILKLMVEQRPEITWAFAGWGPLNPESWNALNVRVFSDLRDASLAPLYRACDLFVLPSTGEGFPLVIQEALASGLPVVCSSETLTADPAMDPFVRGVTICAGDDNRTAREFLLAIDESIAPDAQSQHTPEQLRAFATSRYSWHSTVERYLQIMSRLVSEIGSKTKTVVEGI